MKRRPSREINIFNLSMLDVICSALGAILILFILSKTAESHAQAELQKKDAQLERFQQDLMKAQQQLAKSLKDLAQANKELAELARNPGGLAVGMCETTASRVVARIFDHGTVDGDQVDFTLNNTFIRRDVYLPAEIEAFVLPLDLKPGPNYLGAHALTEGSSPPNTATVIIEPCRDGKPEVFKWDMKKGEKRHISIVRQ